MQYTDPMGNYAGYDYDPDEEERRRREEEERARLEAGKPLVHTVKINPDGTQDVTIKGPVSGIQKAVGTMTPKAEPTMAAPAPMSPDDLARYNAKIRLAESGNRPDIGFHNTALSTAFGPTGLTAAAWQDARRADSSLPEDIRQASQEQLARGQNLYTAQNAQALQKFGQPVNPNTLSTAHLLGAKGLNDFMTRTDEQGRPYLSPAAQAANGGYDKLAAIANQRLGGAMAPASGGIPQPLLTTGLNAPKLQTGLGPTQIPSGAPMAPTSVAPYDMGEFAGVDQAIAEQARQPQPQYTEQQFQANWDEQMRMRAMNSFVTNQDNPRSLEELIANPDTPDDIRDMARKQNFQLINQARQKAIAQEKFTKAPPTQQAKMIAGKGEEGSILRAWLYSIIGFHQGAQAEINKMNLPGKWDHVVNDKGEQVGYIQYSQNGKPLQGTKTDGTEMSEKELLQLGGTGKAEKGRHQSTEVFKDPTGVVKGSFVLETNAAGRDPVYKEVGSGRIATTEESAVLNKTGVAGTLDMQRMRQIQKQNIDLAGDWAKLQMKVAGAAPEAANRFLGEFAAKYPDVPVTLSSLRGPPPQISLDTQKIEMPAGTTGAPVQQGTTTAPAAGATTAGTTTAPVQQNATTAGATTATSGTTPSPAQAMANTDIATANAKDLNKANREFSDSLAKNRQTALIQNSTIYRLQKSIDKNPEFWGIDTESPAWRAFVDVNSTNADKAESLNTLARNLNIPKDKRAAFDATMNDYRSLQVNAITGSGLTASQTNTERESQRVMGTVGSLSDKPAAAKATLEFAKAKVEYTDAKAREWAKARKANPGVDQLQFELDFDADKGEKIFEDANKRMEKIIAGARVGQGGTATTTPAAAAQEGQKSTSKSGKPIVYRNGRWEYQ